MTDEKKEPKQQQERRFVRVRGQTKYMALFDEQVCWLPSAVLDESKPPPTRPRRHNER
jgi:hypothetical protein